jgi:hypothetical protein
VGANRAYQIKACLIAYLSSLETEALFKLRLSLLWPHEHYKQKLTIFLQLPISELWQHTCLFDDDLDDLEKVNTMLYLMVSVTM